MIIPSPPLAERLILPAKLESATMTYYVINCKKQPNEHNANNRAGYNQNLLNQPEIHRFRLRKNYFCIDGQ